MIAVVGLLALVVDVGELEAGVGLVDELAAGAAECMGEWWGMRWWLGSVVECVAL
jgi:hypothetical protein